MCRSEHGDKGFKSLANSELGVRPRDQANNDFGESKRQKVSVKSFIPKRLRSRLTNGRGKSKTKAKRI